MERIQQKVSKYEIKTKLTQLHVNLNFIKSLDFCSFEEQIQSRQFVVE